MREGNVRVEKRKKIEAVRLVNTVAILWVLHLCAYNIGHNVPNYPQVAVHHTVTVTQLHINVVTLATMILSAILWVLMSI